MGKTHRKYSLLEPQAGFLIKEGTVVGVCSSSDRDKTTDALGVTEAEHWFGIAERNLVVSNEALPTAFKANMNGKTYYFDKYGTIASNPSEKVYIVVSKNYRGTPQTEGVVDEGLKVDMSVVSDASDAVNTRFGEYNPSSPQSKAGPMTILRPKDQFALAAMQAIVSAMPNPIGMSYGTITMIAELSYSIGQAMYEKAMEVRNTVKNKIDSTTKEIFVNPDYDLDEVSDVVVYNTAMCIKELTKAVKGLNNNFSLIRVGNQLPIWYNPMTESWHADVVNDQLPSGYETINIDISDLMDYYDIQTANFTPSINEVYNYVTSANGLDKTLYWKSFNTHLTGESAGIVDAINNTNSIPNV